MATYTLQFSKKPPRKLAALIELINDLPSDLAIRRTITPTALREKAEAEGKLDSLSDVIYQAISDLSHNLKNYVLLGFWEGSKPNKNSFDAIKEGGVIERYEQLWDAYLILREVARHPDKDKKPDLWILNPLHASKVFLEIDAQGILRDVKTLFFLAIEDSDIEAERIRECPVCKRIFWAGRVTMKGCSPRCGNTFRVHRHRYRTQEEKAEYELRRARREDKRQKAAQKKSKLAKKKRK